MGPGLRADGANRLLARGSVAFMGFGSDGSQRGIYIDRGGTLMKILDEENALDGKGLRAFQFGPEGLSGDQIASMLPNSGRPQFPNPQLSTFSPLDSSA